MPSLSHLSCQLRSPETQAFSCRYPAKTAEQIAAARQILPSVASSYARICSLPALARSLLHRQPWSLPPHRQLRLLPPHPCLPGPVRRPCPLASAPRPPAASRRCSINSANLERQRRRPQPPLRLPCPARGLPTAPAPARLPRSISPCPPPRLSRRRPRRCPQHQRPPRQQPARSIPSPPAQTPAPARKPLVRRPNLALLLPTH